MTNVDVDAVVRHFYKTRLTNDVEACLTCFTPDIEFRLAGSPEASPVDCSCCGSDELREIFSALVDTWHWLDVDFHSITISDNRAAVH